LNSLFNPKERDKMVSKDVANAVLPLLVYSEWDGPGSLVERIRHIADLSDNDQLCITLMGLFSSNEK
jgi:hypothetical protein